MNSTRSKMMMRKKKMNCPLPLLLEMLSKDSSTSSEEPNQLHKSELLKLRKRIRPLRVSAASLLMPYKKE
jgi:hypothetical protein